MYNTFEGKRYGRTTYVYGAILVLLIGIFVGAAIDGIIAPKTRENSAAEKGNGGRMVPSAEERTPRVSASTVVEWAASFTECGHEVRSEGLMDTLGMAMEDVALRHPEYDIRIFSSERALLRRTLEGYCPRHYVLKLSDDGLGVFQTDEASLKIVSIMNLDADAFDFNGAEMEALTVGIAFNNLEDINRYLESAEN